MLNFLPGPLKGGFSFLLYLINTVVMCTPLFAVALLKLVMRVKPFQMVCDRMLIAIAWAWISVNVLNAKLFSRIKWDVQGCDGLEQEGWYLVLANHQSWVDILILQTVFRGKIPFLKFFLKKELIWVPILGVAWWALDFPFMRRYSRQFLEKHPHLKGTDLERTRKACEKFKKIPISVMNFVEGTRFTPNKHAAQKSPYRHLLTPRAGGVAFVLGAMGEQMRHIVDVTIVYPDGAVSFWEFLCGRLRRVIVSVRTMPVTRELIGDYFNDPAYKKQFCQWINRVWQRKDDEIHRLLDRQQT